MGRGNRRSGISDKVDMRGPLSRGERDRVRARHRCRERRGLQRVEPSFEHELRRRQTDAEKRLWSCLRDRRLAGHKFRRQQPFGPFVVDFYCDAARLVIEVDGGGHGEPGQRAYDRQRTLALERLGLRVLRFWNDDVLVRTEAVVDVILAALGDGRSP